MSHVPPLFTRRRCFAALGVLATAGALVAVAIPAQALLQGTGGTAAAAASPYTVTTFAAVGGASKPDDIVRLGDYMYVGFQNGVGPNGEAGTNGTTTSTVQQYALDGTPGSSWKVTGRVDGMGVDTATGHLLVTTNEDSNSSFHTIDPASASVTDFAYVGLAQGGGTDAVTVFNGKIVVTGSHPAAATDPAVYSVSLQGANAVLTPGFPDNSSATVINGGTTTTLALTDVDSNTVVPAAVPGVGGTFAVVDQTSQQLVFSADPVGATPALTVLNLALSVDDTSFAKDSTQTLWVTDQRAGTVSMVTGAFPAGTAVSSVSADGTTYIATLNLTDGSLTRIPELAAIHPKGLIFTDAAHAVTPVPVSTPAVPVTTDAKFTG